MMKATLWLVVAAAALGAGVAHASATTEGTLRDARGDLPLEHTDVAIHVDGFLADATVTQRFHNSSATNVEAVYLFPLPANAAVTALDIVIGQRRIHGELHERSKARRIYEAARDRGKVAALMTQERPNLFSQTIANLEPGATVEITIRYVERLAYAEGGYELVFPMVAIPRVGGEAGVQPVAAVTRPGHDISLSVDLDAAVSIEKLASPSHHLVVDGAHVRISDDDMIPNKDFVLRYDVAGRDVKWGALSYRDGDQGSFLMIAQPPKVAGAIAPREVVFALDTSSSMRGAPLAKAKELIRRTLATLRPDDTFSIVRFDDAASALGPAPIANKPRNVELALDWLARLDAGGGTTMTTGIEAALALPHDPARLRIVAFVTDGYVGNEDEILRTLAAKIGASRLFAFGVGSAVNRFLLDELGELGRGTAQYVRPDEDTAAAVERFRARIDAPVLTDVSVDWHGLAVSDVGAIPDLFAGQPLVISGHYATAGAATVTVHGHMAGRDVAFEVPVTLAAHDVARPAIATVWARKKIAELTRAQLRRDDPARVREIIGLSLTYRVLTGYTSFVAVDESSSTRGEARRVVVPVAVPDAVAGISTKGYGTIGVTYGYGGGYASIGAGHGYMTSHAVAVPVVMIGSPQVRGDLDKTIIRRYLRYRMSSIQFCYEHELQSKPKLEGTVQTTFFVNGNGVVEDATATGVDDKVAACVAGVLKEIQFPKAIDGGSVRINYPFTFKANVVIEENR